jgi:tellurite resistance protein TerC
MHNRLWFWILFNLFVLLLLALDLALFHRRPREIKFREALGWSVFWIALAAAFAAFIFFESGRIKTLEFITGYLIEESLSVDNLFIFLLIFRYFKVAGDQQHKVLFWGILGALLTRGAFILAGVTLIRQFHWIIYVFGGFLVYTGCRLFGENEQKVEPERNPVLRLFRRFLPVTGDYVDGKFFVLREGRRFATPLLMVVLAIEATDILFAADSIPAVLAITRDPFIVYTSNVFAVLGLRALYFLLAGMMNVFHFLNYGLAIILILIGAKMLASDYYSVATGVTLAVVVGILAASVGVSLLFPKAAAE